MMPAINNFWRPALFLCICLHAILPAIGQETLKIINFDSVDATHGRVVASIYMAKHGISISNVTQGTIVVIENTKNIYDGRAMVADSSPNVLTQINSNDPVSFTLNFPSPLIEVRFTRPFLLAGPTGITFPEWRAIAIDEGGREIDEAGEPPRGYYSNEPARTFVLKGPGIKSLRFDSKNHHFAAFSAVVIDNLSFKTASRGSDLNINKELNAASNHRCLPGMTMEGPK
jgi:hypothetical protein